MHPNDVTLGDYLDATLPLPARAQVDAHLAGCSECRALVADLREVGRAVAALESVKPPARTWTRIAEAVAGARPPAGQAEAAARPAATAHDPASAGRYVMMWLATAAALVLATLATLVGLRIGRPAPDPVIAADSAAAQSVEAELVESEQPYQNAIDGLEKIADTWTRTLDPQTAATLTTNLAVVNQAISESRAALTTQPDNRSAQASLLENVKTKVALLEDTVALINDMRKVEGT